jgi:hypothetical protein
MRNAPVVTLMSAVFLAGCQASDGSLDWRRMGNVAGSTVMAAGGLLLGGPAGAAAGLTIGSNLFTNTGQQNLGTRAAYPRQMHSSNPQKVQRSGSVDSAAIASPKPQEPDTPKPVPAADVATSGIHATETIGI